jgi:acyl carrier protein
MSLEKIKQEIKEMIIEECEKDEFTPEQIPDDVELFSPKCELELDSLDALTISMGLKKMYGVRLGDSKEFRRTVTTIEKLAEYIKNNG